MSMVQNGAIIGRRERGVGEEIGQNIISNRDGMATTQVASTRAAEEVKAAMTIAKMMPRDEISAQTRIVNACRRESLARVAIYSYPRGNQNVSGPSIRLAEVMAQCWGNIDFGIIELEQRFGESTVMAYAWDLETNTRRQTQFTVKHVRTKGKGADKQHTNLDDPRDIYEMNANQGARRLRACILGVIPRDVQDAAIEEVKKTLAGDNETPIIDRIKKMVQVFAEVQVSQEMIEKRLGYRVDKATEKDLFDLRGIFTAIRDGQYGREDYFDVGDAQQRGEEKSLAEKINQTNQQPTPATNKPSEEIKVEPTDTPAREFANFEQFQIAVSEFGESKDVPAEKIKELLNWAKLSTDANKVGKKAIDARASIFNDIVAGKPVNGVTF